MGRKRRGHDAHIDGALPAGMAAAEWVALDTITPWADNPRDNDKAVDTVAASIERYGFGAPIVCRTANREIIKGHTRRKAVIKLHGVFPGQPAPWMVPVRFLDLAEDEAHELALSDNASHEIATWDQTRLAQQLEAIRQRQRPLPPGFDTKALDRLLEQLRRRGERPTDQQIRQARATLAERFLVPPFSVLDARQGYWQERKRAWLHLGIRSELGRASALQALSSASASEAQAGQYVAKPPNLTGLDMRERGDDFAAAAAAKMGAKSRKPRGGGGLAISGLKAADIGFYEKKRETEAALGRELTTAEFQAEHWDGGGESPVQGGTSIFDPVLCELVYRWFCPPGGVVLDCFAGGSVRGITAAVLGRAYVGFELRGEQVAANAEQWRDLAPRLVDSAPARADTDPAPPPSPDPRWLTGDARDLVTKQATESADILFCCPPYSDLERYSDDPRDLSTMDYAVFLSALRQVIHDAAARLKPDRFAVMVVGDVRDPRGFYRDFVGDVVQAHRDAGLQLYNEAILVTSVGSLSMRAGRYFAATRKLGKGHQQCLVFVKGDPKRATQAIGTVEVGDLPETEAAE